jgi:dihydroneopterin aldolase
LTAEKPFPDNASMPERIVIERLEFSAHCGITEEERGRPQPIAVDVEIETPGERAGASDRLTDTIDYAEVANRIAAVGTTERCHLVEALAEKLIAMIFAEFPADRLHIWVRKLRAPLSIVVGSVGVRVERTRAAQEGHSPDAPPAAFLMQQMSRIPKGRILDLAAGRGRNTLYLLVHGMEVHAIDRDAEAMRELTTAAQSRHLTGLTTQTVDLEADRDHPPSLGEDRYDAVIVCFYLHRPLFPHIMEALKPNGILLYETFTIENYFRRHHPRRWEFCLAQNELLRLTSPLQVLHYDEGEHESDHGCGPIHTARLVAQKVRTSPQS